MSLQPRRSRETLLTEQTAVWLLPGVCSDVHVEVGGAPEPPLAVGAGIRPLSCVDPLVEEELAGGEEGLPALGALVRPLPRVGQVVSDERGRLGEPLPATAARERSLSRVCVEVFALSSLGFEALWALWASERLEVAMAALVPRQLSVREERLLAGGADVRPLARVDSLVAREAGQLGEALLAVGALERSLAVVSQQMPVEDLELREALSALCAWVRTLPGVNLLVLIQKPHVRETFPTLAGERTLAGVFHLVPLEVRRSAVYLLTHGALVLMPHQVSLPVLQTLQDATEALPTFLAFVLTAFFLRRHLRYHDLRRKVKGRVASLTAGGTFVMQLEQTHLCEAFATQRAEEGSLSGVNALMSGQIPRVLEALLTFLAGVRALARVCPLVASQVRGAFESFATLLARVRVGPVVDGERLWEVGTPGLLLGDIGCLCRLLEFAVLLWVAVLDVLQQVRLLHVEKWTL